MSKLDAHDFDDVLSRIEEGTSQAEIAKDLDCAVSTLNAWLHSTPERSARARTAMQASAESWLDRGLNYVVSARSDAVEIARARIMEQHCARRAAIRNPATHGDKLDLTHSGSLKVVQVTELTSQAERNDAWQKP